jgi:hypothetical protein
VWKQASTAKTETSVGTNQRQKEYGCRGSGSHEHPKGPVGLPRFQTFVALLCNPPPWLSDEQEIAHSSGKSGKNVRLTDCHEREDEAADGRSLGQCRARRAPAGRREKLD